MIEKHGAVLPVAEKLRLNVSFLVNFQGDSA